MSGYNHQASYPNSSVHNNQSTMESEAHRQYMASMRRRAPPPRFRPPMIIFMVLMGGLVFIGLVMTIIAVWPGYTPVGGNPLKIAGPILLALGGIGFIVGIVLICRKSQDEKKDFARSFYAASSQRSLGRSQTNITPTPSMDAKPGKGILKNPSSSSYNGTVVGEGGSDSGMPAHSFSTNRSYEGSEGSDAITGQGHVVGRVPPVSLNPDPTAAYRGQQRYPGGPVDHSSSTESEQAVMAHMTNASRAPQKHSSSYQNQAYAKETDIDGDIEGPRATSTGKREMQQYGNSSFDAYDASQVKKQQQKNLQLPRQNPRWGQNRDRPSVTPPTQRGTTPPPLRSSGVFNDAYEVETQVSTVSQQYSQYTTPQRQVVQTRETYEYSPATTTASPATGINTSSVSTEV